MKRSIIIAMLLFATIARADTTTYLFLSAFEHPRHPGGMTLKLNPDFKSGMAGSVMFSDGPDVYLAEGISGAAYQNVDGFWCYDLKGLQNDYRVIMDDEQNKMATIIIYRFGKIIASGTAVYNEYYQ